MFSPKPWSSSTAILGKDAKKFRIVCDLSMGRDGGHIWEEEVAVVWSARSRSRWLDEVGKRCGLFRVSPSSRKESSGSPSPDDLFARSGRFGSERERDL